MSATTLDPRRLLAENEALRRSFARLSPLGDLAYTFRNACVRNERANTAEPWNLEEATLAHEAERRAAMALLEAARQIGGHDFPMMRAMTSAAQVPASDAMVQQWKPLLYSQDERDTIAARISEAILSPTVFADLRKLIIDLRGA